MTKKTDGCYYGDYINVGHIQDGIVPLSKKQGQECHDEYLFIVVHQAFELWFAQIIHELKSLVTIFNQESIEEKKLSTVSARLERIKKIQSLFNPHLEILETMTPMDFLEFRDYIHPASGFQSVQFREIEITLGLGTSQRQSIDREFFVGRLSKEDRQKIDDIEKRPNLFLLIENWLERMPFTQMQDFSFWETYQKCVQGMLDREEVIIQNNKAALGQEVQEAELANLKLTRKQFEFLFNSNEKTPGQLSAKARLNALFIFLYRDEPILHTPFQILTHLMDIDENFSTWRYRHAILAQRMLGKKIGTGGSSGHQYLRRTADFNRIFVDLFELSSFLIPRNQLPAIPTRIREEMGYSFSPK